MTQRIVPEPLLPGAVIKAEIDSRGWKQIDLAHIMGVTSRVINELVSGKRRITPKTARALADAFGNQAEEWLRFQSLYDLAQEALPADNLRQRKAALWNIAPIREMTNRGWLADSENIGFLEAQVRQFFGIGDLTETPALAVARRSTDCGDVTREQRAWLQRAKNIAESLPMENRYSSRSFKKMLNDLAVLRGEPEEARRVPEVLRNYGIRFLVVQHLPSSKIDGVCFWLRDQPVIVLSLRYNRIDWFWFTLAHELGHVHHRHGLKEACLDTSLVGSDAQPFDEKPVQEQLADKFATQYLVDRSELDDFITRVAPSFAHEKIVGFARRIGVHPGIVVGRLHHMRRIPYSHGRRMLVQVKDIIIQTALTDGWGHTLSM